MLSRSIRDLQNEVDDLFDRFFRSANTNLLSNGSPSSTATSSANLLYSPPLDLVETPEAYHVRMDLPGMDRDEIKVAFDGGTLRISGAREEEHASSTGQYHRVERWRGSVFRALNFDRPVEEDRISATFDRGVLTVIVPKSEPTASRTIEIEETSRAADEASENA